ncbi:ATP-binding protein [Streptomyces sp. RB6PN25]|uniref:ATP-binding protein n=1 Tax=Streptomyces humicola TaxID=2953240 RepID=A0ABT1PZM3_9ACTN|nr:ATP-binding protein [Streptomyces humicola]MCQ4083079.1 ATP-binding protein [Streptomyces humicola]
MAGENHGERDGRDEAVAGTVDVLVICGAAGVGKSETAREISHRLSEAGTAHAVVDCDELDRVHPWPVPGLPPWEPARRNLAAVWANYARLGHTRLMLCGVLADLRQELPWIAQAVPDAAFTVVRLTAGIDELHERVRRRGPGTGRREQLCRTARQVEQIAATDPPATLVVDTTGLDVPAVAARVIALWPAVAPA